MGKKILANHICDKGFVSQYKEQRQPKYPTTDNIN